MSVPTQHVASNSYTRYRPYPTPAQFTASPELISRTTTFLRRELQVWDDLDVEFLTSFTISVMKAIDIRSESAVKLLAEFLDMDSPYVEGGRHVNAEHFAHGKVIAVITSEPVASSPSIYVKSPFRDLFVYDTVVQKIPLRRTNAGVGDGSRCPDPILPPGLILTPVLVLDLVIHYPSSNQRRATFTSPHRHRSRSGGRHHNEDRPRDQTNSSLNDAVRGTSRRPTGTAKGKGRADPEPESVITEDVAAHDRPGPQAAAGSAFVAQGDSRLDSHAPQTQASTLIRTKPPRNRTLLESVQAHLTLRTEARSNGSGNQSEKGKRCIDAERHPGISSLTQESSSTVPALLARLTDPTEMARPTDRGPEFNALTFLGSTANRHQGLPSADNRTTVQPSRMSAPEIMARTRARMAKNDRSVDLNPRSISQSEAVVPSSSSASRPGIQERVFTHESIPTQASPPGYIATAEDFTGGKAKSGVENSPSPRATSTRGRATNKNSLQLYQIPISRSSDDLRHHEAPSNAHHMAMWGNSSDERPSISAHINDQSHPSSDNRTKLLARLEREKHHALNVDTGVSLSAADHCGKPPNTDHDSYSRTPGKAIDTVVSPHLIEAQLRTRAQLQVRLAAEKRRSDVQ
ncbi:hypothetical protein D9615_008609 [Tricholomella constricta]|uniref:Uncharacterized protein n=1 Tax=Tricholomella constricta TaxID=117010 RepID=A0A8H5H4U8_9AGAR|nr:hypothetical protein D9615_008609 [Tricholomella constricta]